MSSSTTSTISSIPTSNRFTEDDLNVFRIAVHFSAALSCIGSAAVFFTYFFKNDSKINNNRLVFWMSIADFLGALHLFFGVWPITVFESSIFCTYQAYAVQYFLLAAMLWTACMFFQCLLAVTSKRALDSLIHLEKYYHLICWGIPALVSVILAIYGSLSLETNVMGNAVLWCWITSKYQELRMIFFFGPLWVIFAFNLIVYIYIGRYVMASQKALEEVCFEPNDTRKTMIVKKNTHVLKKYAFRTSLFLLAFFFNWSFGSINRVQNIIAPNYPIFSLFLLHALFTPLQGFINSFVYFWITFFQNRNRLLSKSKSADNSLNSIHSSTAKSDIKTLLNADIASSPTPPPKNARMSHYFDKTSSSYIPKPIPSISETNVPHDHRVQIESMALTIDEQLKLNDMLDQRNSMLLGSCESNITPLMMLMDIEKDIDEESPGYDFESSYSI